MRRYFVRFVINLVFNIYSVAAAVFPLPENDHPDVRTLLAVEIFQNSVSFAFFEPIMCRRLIFIIAYLVKSLQGTFQ